MAFVSIRIMGNSPASGQLDKMVLDDAVDGFIKNLSYPVKKIGMP